MSKPYTGKYYKLVKIPDHPLATVRGVVRLHRAVLYEKIGPGTHPCHWCGKALRWVTQLEGKSTPPDAILGDHLDGDIQNNSPKNLVPSCNGCNSLRRRGWRIQDGELFLVDERGDRVRAVEVECAYCRAKFLARPRKARKFCGKSCSGKYGSAMRELAAQVGK